MSCVSDMGRVMGHVKIPRQMSRIKGRIWIPGKQMLSSISRGPSVSLNFGVFFYEKTNGGSYDRRPGGPPHATTAMYHVLSHRRPPQCQLFSSSSPSSIWLSSLPPHPSSLVLPTVSSDASTLPYAEGWPRVLWGFFFFFF
jgi:hypothetical protein